MRTWPGERWLLRAVRQNQARGLQLAQLNKWVLSVERQLARRQLWERRHELRDRFLTEAQGWRPSSGPDLLDAADTVRLRVQADPGSAGEILSDPAGSAALSAVG